MFDAGALMFKVQTVGAAQFQADQKAIAQATEKSGRAAKDTGKQLNEQGKATDSQAKKARESKKPLEEQAKATEQVGTKSKTAAQKQREQARALEEQKRAAQEVGQALLVAGAAMGAMVALSVAKAAEFDRAMSQTSAAVMATREEQEALSEAALEAGADTAYSASEAAAAEEELAKAGIEVADIVRGSLTGALSLAAAGQLEVARSAEIMATTLKQYRLPAAEAGHVSDLLAAGAGKAQGSVDDLAQALQYVGPVTAGLKISVEETTGALALFAANGQLGERAGTGLRGVLMSLTAPSKIAAATMEEYGVQIFNADGSMKSLAEVAQQLQGAFGGLTEKERSNALGRIFGNEQITAARVLYEGGAKAITEWTDKVNDAGYAERQAAQRTDNLIGDLERLGGAFDTTFIKQGTGANDVLRGLVQTVEGAVDWFGQLPDPLQQTGLYLGVAATAVTLMAGGALTLVGRLGELKTNFELMNTSMRRTAVIGGLAGLALTGVVTVVGLLASAHAEAQARAKEYADAIKAGGDAAENFVAGQLAMKDSFLWMDRGSAVENAKKLGIGLDEVTEAVKGSASEYEAFKERVQEAYDAAGQTLDAGYAMEQLTNKVDSLRAAEEEAHRQIADTSSAQALLNDSTSDGAVAADSAASSYLAEADAAAELGSELSKLIDQINEANDLNKDAITASLDYESALDEVEAQIKAIAEGQEGYALGIGEGEEATRANKELLLEQSTAAQEAAAAQYELDRSTGDYVDRLTSARETFIENATALSGNRDEAIALADAIFDIPSEKEIEVLADTQTAIAQIDGFIRDYSGRSVPVYVTTMRTEEGRPVNTGQFADGAVVDFYAGGGIRESHVAQIARAGDVRVWAEPETGGESYIPHALSKRARSEAILAETARRFGGRYVPMADGAVRSPAGGAPTATFTGDFYLQGMTPAEVRALIREEWNRMFNRGGYGR